MLLGGNRPKASFRTPNSARRKPPESKLSHSKFCSAEIFAQIVLISFVDSLAIDVNSSMNRSTDIDRSLWHHSPEHRFIPGATYMITASTRHRENFFSTTDRLILLRKTLFITIADRHWTLIAWALFSAHYHFIARAPDPQGSLKRLIQAFHSLSARS